MKLTHAYDRTSRYTCSAGELEVSVPQCPTHVHSTRAAEGDLRTSQTKNVPHERRCHVRQTATQLGNRASENENSGPGGWHLPIKDTQVGHDTNCYRMSWSCATANSQRVIVALQSLRQGRHDAMHRISILGTYHKPYRIRFVYTWNDLAIIATTAAERSCKYGCLQNT